MDLVNIEHEIKQNAHENSLILIFSDIDTREIRKEYKATIDAMYGLNGSYINEDIKTIDRLEGETIIQPGEHFAFSPCAEEKAYISIRTADKVLA